jgi:hypothetical protein
MKNKFLYLTLFSIFFNNIVYAQHSEKISANEQLLKDAHAILEKYEKKYIHIASTDEIAKELKEELNDIQSTNQSPEIVDNKIKAIQIILRDFTTKLQKLPKKFFKRDPSIQ